MAIESPFWAITSRCEGDQTKVKVTIRLTTSRLNKPQDIVVAPADRTDRRINFQIGPANIPAGLYGLSTLVAPIGSTDEPPPTVEVPLLLAPKLVGLPGAVARTNVVDGLGDATIAVTCSPDILTEQTVTLALGDVSLQAAPRATATTALSFTAEQKFGAGRLPRPAAGRWSGQSSRGFHGPEQAEIHRVPESNDHMNDPNEWQECNERQLAAALAELRQRLERYIQQQTGTKPLLTGPSAADSSGNRS